MSPLVLAQVDMPSSTFYDTHGLLRALHFHNPPSFYDALRIAPCFALSQFYPLFTYREAGASLPCSYRGRSQGLTSPLVQAQVDMPSSTFYDTHGLLRASHFLNPPNIRNPQIYCVNRSFLILGQVPRSYVPSRASTRGHRPFDLGIIKFYLPPFFFRQFVLK